MFTQAHMVGFEADAENWMLSTFLVGQILLPLGLHSMTKKVCTYAMYLYSLSNKTDIQKHRETPATLDPSIPTWLTTSCQPITDLPTFENGVNFEFEVKYALEGHDQSPHKTIGIPTKEFYISGQNLVILAETVMSYHMDKLMIDGQTHTHKHRQWQYPKAKTGLG